MRIFDQGDPVGLDEIVWCEHDLKEMSGDQRQREKECGISILKITDLRKVQHSGLWENTVLVRGADSIFRASASLDSNRSKTLDPNSNRWQRQRLPA